MNLISSTIIVIVLFTLCHSRKFIPIGFPDGGDDSNNPVTFELNIRENRTTITIYAFQPVWFGIGFGGTTMSTATHAITIRDLSSWPNEIVEDREVTGQSTPNVLASDLWTEELFETEGLSKTPAEPAKIVISRDNDVSATCSECYTFDPDIDTLDMILAKGSSETFTKHTDGNRKGETVIAKPLTEQPTEMPTGVPTADPTRQPTQAPIFEECVNVRDILDGVDLRMYRDVINERVGILIEADGDNDNWFGVGFGNDKMNGTYAVIGGVDGVEVQERRLKASALLGEAVGTQIDTDNFYRSSTINGVRRIEVIRPYSLMGTYDFDSFINCVEYQMPVIAAKGMGNTLGYHGVDNRGIGVVNNGCCDLPSTTMYESTNVEPTEKTTKGECENGAIWTFPKDCDQSVCDKCNEDLDNDGVTCIIDPCGCSATCDDSMAVAKIVHGMFVMIGIVVMMWM